MIDFKKNEGVTLIILVITVVILTIITGILIASNSKNEEIVDIANRKKEETEKLSLKEEIQLDLSENPPNNYDELIERLKKYGTIENKDNQEIAALVTTQGGYSMKINELWNLNAKSVGVKIGDYIQYIYDGGNYTIESNVIGNSAEVQINIPYNGGITWRVIDVENNNNVVKIIPTNLTTSALKLTGANGYNNAVKVLNDACNEIFSNKSLGTKARNINLNDIEKLGSNIEEQKGNLYESKKEYDNASYPLVILEEDNDYEQSKFYNGIEKTRKLVLSNSFYSGKVTYKEDYLEIIPYGQYWLSTRSINNSENAEFLINNISVNDDITINGSKLYDSSDKSSSSTMNILPVVILDRFNFSEGMGTLENPYKIAN